MEPPRKKPGPPLATGDKGDKGDFVAPIVVLPSDILWLILGLCQPLARLAAYGCCKQFRVAFHQHNQSLFSTKAKHIVQIERTGQAGARKEFTVHSFSQAHWKNGFDEAWDLVAAEVIQPRVMCTFLYTSARLDAMQKYDKDVRRIIESIYLKNAVKRGLEVDLDVAPVSMPNESIQRNLARFCHAGWEKPAPFSAVNPVAPPKLVQPKKVSRAQLKIWYYQSLVLPPSP